MPTPSNPNPSGQSPATLQPILADLVVGRTLDETTAAATFSIIMTGQADPPQIGAVLALIQSRGATVAELTGAARVMRAHVSPVPIDPKFKSQIIDTCGTGGAPKTFNISTAAALVAAGAGAKVPKHGNRSRTGRGSAEVLQQLGVNIDASPETQAHCLAEAGISFSFAIHHHPAIKHAMPARHALGFPTIFNLLGPLTNPAGASRQLIGVYQPEFTELLAHTLANLGSTRAIIVHGRDGLDEMTTTAPTLVSELTKGKVTTRELDALDYGLPRAALADLQVNTLPEAAACIESILASEPGPQRDIVIWNTAAALWIAELADDLGEGVARATTALESGAARAALDKLIHFSNQDEA